MAAQNTVSGKVLRFLRLFAAILPEPRMNAKNVLTANGHEWTRMRENMAAQNSVSGKVLRFLRLFAAIFLTAKGCENVLTANGRE